MVELTDLTLIESEGNYKTTVALMGEGSSDWMLRSEALVSVGPLAFNYLIHFWHDRTACIMETNHPPVLEVPDYDIRELYEWCKDNGWNLSLHKSFLDDQRQFEFWMRIFRTGLVDSEDLRKHEQEEIDRLTAAMKSEKMETDDAD